MVNCIMCGKPVDNYPGFITDGVIAVCKNCAASNSLMRVMTRIENSGKTANLTSVFSPLIEVGLVNQTDGERVELDKDKLDAKRELESGLVNQTDSNKPQGYMPDCPFIPCYECRFYCDYLDSCMVGEEGIVPTEEEVNKVREALGEEAARDFFAPLKPVGVMYDIETMSQDDFYSKYADKPSALSLWHDYHGESSEYTEV